MPAFSARRRKAGSPLHVIFTDQSLPAEEIETWKWDFNGDGIIDSTEQNPTHIYSSPGDYTVVLEVSISESSDYIIKTNYISVLAPEKNTINSSFSGAFWVHGSDVDNDGDCDILGASKFDYELARWDNVDVSASGTGDASEFQKISIDTVTGDYKHLYAIDIDQSNGIDIIAIGNRYAKSYDESIEFIKLDPFIDLNLGIEYRYSRILSAFVSLNNITSSEYYIWNQYPAYRFNFLVGFTYKL